MPVPGSRPPRSGPPSGGGGGYPRPQQRPPYAPNNRFEEADRPEAPAPVKAPLSPPSAPLPKPTVSSSGTFTSEEVRDLIKLVHDQDITELTLERDNGAQRLVIKRERPAPAPVMMTPAVQAVAPAPVAPPPSGSLSFSAAPAPGSVIPDPGAPPVDSFHKVVSPMVGTFYSRPDPKDPAFINVGDMVEKDQVIGIIEAMKIMNEIKSEHRGRCVRVSVENGQPVEYGQTIMLLEPA